LLDGDSIELVEASDERGLNGPEDVELFFEVGEGFVGGGEGGFA